ncbi:hypothetical protein pb186bvf_007313 [Paramecium bursaria]
MQTSTPFKQTESRYLPATNQYNISSKSPSSNLQSEKMQFSNEKNDRNDNLLSSGPHFDTIEPMQVQCQNCHTFSSSVVQSEFTNFTYGSIIVLILLCCCWMPFVFKKYFQRIQHLCPACDRVIGQFDFFEEKILNR